MSRIKRITSVPKSLLIEMQEKWLAIGLSTAPSDYEKGKAAIIALHKQLRLSPPSIWVQVDSPFALVQAVKSLRNRSRAQVYAQVRDQVNDQVRAQVSAQVYAQVRAQVYDQVYAQVSAQVRAQVSAQVYDQVYAQVNDQVYDQVSAQVYAQVSAQVSDQVYDQVNDQVRAQVYDPLPYWIMCGQFMASLCSWWETYQRLSLHVEVEPLYTIAETLSWWMPLGIVCILSPHPSILKRDERGRLHADDGMAIAWADGWGIYAWHGVRVPEHVIVRPETLTARATMNESNIEVRRVMMERMGHERFIDQLDAKELDRDTDGAGMPRRLLSVALPTDDPERQIVVVEVNDPSTMNRYLLRVPPSVRTCADAVAWTFDVELQDYQPIAEA